MYLFEKLKINYLRLKMDTTMIKNKYLLITTETDEHIEKRYKGTTFDYTFNDNSNAITGIL